MVGIAGGPLPATLDAGAYVWIPVDLALDRGDQYVPLSPGSRLCTGWSFPVLVVGGPVAGVELRPTHEGRTLDAAWV